MVYENILVRFGILVIILENVDLIYLIVNHLKILEGNESMIMKKFRWIKKRRLLKNLFVYICLIVIILLLTLNWWKVLLIDSSISNSKNNIDINAIEYQLKELYVNSLKINVKKGIVIVSDRLTQLKYSQLSDALICYSMIHGYIFDQIDPSKYLFCQYIQNFYFQKHCCILIYLLKNRSIEWLMVLDGDNVLVNTSKRMEDYIPNLSNINLIHHERFYNGEISAGNYIIRNCQWSYTYLFNWMNMYHILPSVAYHNNDNGALHLHFALSIGKSSLNCLHLWYKSLNERLYDKYVGCIKCQIGGQRQFDHIWLLRRAHGFTRDYREPENVILENDFLIHGFKNDSLHYYQKKINKHVCRNNIHHWSLPIRLEMIISNRTLAQQLIHYHDIDAQIKHPDSVGIADVFDCWPFCQFNLTGEKETNYLNTLCKNNKSHLHI